MAWLLDDFAFLSVLLKAATLVFEAFVVGGLLFITVIAIPAGPAAQPVLARCRSGIRRAAMMLAITEFLFVAVDTSILIGTVKLPVSQILRADYFLAGTGAILASLVLFLALEGAGARIGSATKFLLFSLPFIAVLAASSVWTSHSISRLDGRLVTGFLTALHQLAVAAWIGAMPFLLISIPAVREGETARFMAKRFSSLAVICVAVLISAGIALSYFYVGSAPALYGTAYGFMILTKSALLLVLLALGGTNWWLVRSLNGRAGNLSEVAASSPLGSSPQPLLFLRRIGEAELGIGFSIILAAASLTSQPPAIDLVQDRLTAAEIVERYHPVVPRFTTPTVDQLSPATPLEEAIHSYDISPVAKAHNQDPDIAWSEYSHHWAGLILLAIGAGAWLAAQFPRFRWARHWPLGFVALAIFSFLRGDPENWPFGPISFWKSFYDPEVALHRIYDLLIASYGLFEWGVQTGRLRSRKAAYVFPVIMALGGAGLLLHTHALGNLKNELLIEMTHNTLGVLAVIAGWARFVEVRMPKGQGGRLSLIAAQVWPACLLLIGLMLLNYREA